MRILQIVHFFPPEQSAGTELYTQALSRTLLSRGHDCFVLAGSKQTALGPGLLIGEQDGLTVIRLVGLRKRGGLRAEVYDSTVEHLVRKCFDLWRPDLVHLQHWTQLTGNLVAICAELGIPSVVTLHDQWIVCSRIHRIQPDGTFCSTLETPCVSCVDRDRWQTNDEVARELSLRQQLINQELRLADCILVPSLAQQRSWFRRLASASFIACARFLLGLEFIDYSIGAKAYRKQTVQPFLERLADGSAYVVQLIAWAKRDGAVITEIPVWCEDLRRSKFNLPREGVYRFGSLFLLWLQERVVRGRVPSEGPRPS